MDFQDQTKNKGRELDQKARKKYEKDYVSAPLVKKDRENVLRQKSFGRRLSGHLRPRHGEENTIRMYFDDEDTSNPRNKIVGEKAEKHVFKLLKNNLLLKNVKLWGGTNKGFDIDYQKEGKNYFVEVKGLSGDWQESDILLSKAQFEKAQIERERYSVYIVEFVEDDAKRRISELQDPALYFNKYQIDHGWRDFVREVKK